MQMRALSFFVLTSLLSANTHAEVTCVLSSFDDSVPEQTLKFDSNKCQNVDKKLLAYAKVRSEARFKQEEEAKAKECKNSRVECDIEYNHLKNSHYWRLKSLTDAGYEHQICLKANQSKLGQKDGPEYEIIVQTLDPSKNPAASGKIAFKSPDKTSTLVDVTDMSLEVMEIQYYDPIVDETPARIYRKITKDTSDMMITCHDDKVNAAINQSSDKKEFFPQKNKAKAKSAIKK